MNQQISYLRARSDKAISPEQFNQILEAILAGKYSWACVLLLRFSGYNPLQYIPYRTYNRLLKENCQIGRATHSKTDSINTEQLRTKDLSSPRKISDLSYLEVVSDQHPKGKGKNLGFAWNNSHPANSLLNVSFWESKFSGFSLFKN